MPLNKVRGPELPKSHHFDILTTHPLYYIAREKQLILDWISKDDWRRRHADLTSIHHPNTGNWIFDTREFKDWMNDTSQVLWCCGAREFYTTSHPE